MGGLNWNLVLLSMPIGMQGAAEADYVYRNWASLSGYFDGDGTVEIRVKGRWVEVRLAFDDNWEPFLEGIRTFLLSRGLNPGSVRRKVQSKTWHIVIVKRNSVKRMCRSMLPYCVKKRVELEGVLAYLNNETTGLQLIELMNHQVIIGQRTGKLRPDGPPFTRLVAAKLGREDGMVRRRETIAHAGYRKRIRSDTWTARFVGR